MTNVTDRRCTICDVSYVSEPGRYVCDSCGDAGTLDVRYDYQAVAMMLSPKSLLADRDPSMWRYRPLLPVGPDTTVTGLGVGGTPLVTADRMAGDLGLESLHIKDEGRQPTASLKDRASAVALARAAEAGARGVTAGRSVVAGRLTESAGTGDTQFDDAVVLDASLDLTTTTVTINSTIDTQDAGNGGTVTITNAGLLDIAAGADMSLDGAFL